MVKYIYIESFDVLYSRDLGKFYRDDVPLRIKALNSMGYIVLIRVDLEDNDFNNAFPSWAYKYMIPVTTSINTKEWDPASFKITMAGNYNFENTFGSRDHGYTLDNLNETLSDDYDYFIINDHSTNHPLSNCYKIDDTFKTWTDIIKTYPELNNETKNILYIYDDVLISDLPKFVKILNWSKK